MFDSLFYFKCGYKPERKEYERMFRDDYFPKLNGNDWIKGEIVKLEEKRQELIREQDRLFATDKW